MSFLIQAEGQSALAEPPPEPRRKAPRIASGSGQQEAFWSELAEGSGHVLLEARAGTGKSSSCREGMYRLLDADPRLVIRYCCFNRKIADEFGADCPPGVEAGTMHRFGQLALQSAFGSKLEKNKTYTLLDQAEGGSLLKRYVRRSINSLVSLAKNHGLRPDDPALVDRLAEFVVFYDVETWGRLGDVVRWATLILARSAEVVTLIDFDDMLWLPVLHGVRFPGVDFLFIDECLPGWTPVLLADGTSKSIREIVDHRLPVDVLAYDTATGTQKPCRVTRWSKTLNRKPLVKIKVRWSRKKGTNRPTNFVVCTTDHKVWADGRWTPAGDVAPGMTVQVETSAAKAQRGKIGHEGRVSLASHMAAKNSSGPMGSPAAKSQPFRGTRGGNGRGPSLAEQTLLDALGEGWVYNCVVATGRRDEGYPRHYKIDAAHPELMIAVEVDGHSHDSPKRKEQDRRKEEFLRSLGWTFHRFKNRRVIQETEACLDEIFAHSCSGDDCPIDAEVVSVEPASIPDSHVYDITVEGCHNFYANGILVHNCQDLNPLQHELAEVLSGSGRTVIVGDPFQAIYGWRGAATDSIPTLRDRLGAKTLPLTVSWRCPRSHVDLARQLVPDFEAAPGAREGTVIRGDASLVDSASPGDMVLCRANAPIVQACLRLVARRVPAIVRGRAIGDQLLGVLRKAEGSAPPATVPAFVRSLALWRAGELARLEAKDGTESLVEQLNDQCMCLEAIASGCSSPTEIPGVIADLFTDDDSRSRVTFSTVHRAKGSEAHNVTYLQIPYSEKRDKLRPPQQWELDQRRNLRYVALSRSLDSLTLVS